MSGREWQAIMSKFMSAAFGLWFGGGLLAMFVGSFYVANTPHSKLDNTGEIFFFLWIVGNGVFAYLWEK